MSFWPCYHPNGRAGQPARDRAQTRGRSGAALRTRTASRRQACAVEIVPASRALQSSHRHRLDALSHLGVRHIDIPITPEKVWTILHEKGVAE